MKRLKSEESEVSTPPFRASPQLLRSPQGEPDVADGADASPLDLIRRLPWIFEPAVSQQLTEG